MPALEISPRKVAYIILKAREYGAKVSPFDDGDLETSDEQGGGDGVLENRPDDPAVLELVGFIRALNQDEQKNLVALAWLGRGTFSLDEWDQALETAEEEATTSTARYLLGMTMLADYLDEGLAAFGIDPAESENEILGGD